MKHTHLQASVTYGNFDDALQMAKTVCCAHIKSDLVMQAC